MSKIFDSLVKDEGTMSHLVRRFTGEPFPPIQERGPQPEASEPANPAPAAQPAVTLRRLPLQVPAGVPVFPFGPDNVRVSEQYRIIRTKILQDPRQQRMIVVSSAAPQDGKTITSINLAGVLALKHELKVVLVEADLHRSHIASLLGFPATPGLADVLSGKAALADALVQVEQCPNLFVIPGGTPHAGATELLDSPAWRGLCEKLRREFTHVVIDSPPMIVLADFELLQAVSDGVVFVVRPDHTNRTECLKALEGVATGKLLGVIVNAVEDWPLYRRSSSKYYEYYGQAKAC